MAQFVNWLKSLFKRDPLSEQLISFNREKLHVEIANLATHLHGHKDDPGIRILLEVIALSRNIAIFDIAKARSETELASYKGRYQCLNDLHVFVETAFITKKDEAKEGNKQPRGTVKAFKRVNNQAGIA